MSATRPRKIESQNTVQGIPWITHDIDQFHWYSDVKRRNSGDRIKAMDFMSAVRFMLPYLPGRDLRSYVVAVGNGSDICNVYFVRVNWGMDTLTGKFPEGTHGLWKVFDYSERKSAAGSKFYTDNHYLKKLREKLPEKLGSIFTTDIMPFLRSGYYPMECDRVYDFGLDGLDKLRMIARNREKIGIGENFEIKYIPHKKNSPEETVIVLPYGKWTNSETIQLFPFTKRFTFASDFNTNAL